MKKTRRGWTPKNWASTKPFGIGEQRPNNYWELLRAVGENRDRLGYAWRILNEGVCDGCALGTTGMKDWTLDGVHLCNIRLRLLRLNTAPEFSADILSDIGAMRKQTSAELRELGRIPRPMIRHAGDAGFTPIPWAEAYDHIAARISPDAPDRSAFYLTSRGMPNECYYAAQKAVRAIGTNNIDNAARICHAPSTVALKRSLGVAATTCSYSDWMKSDLITFIGSNVANNQPVATKYIHYAKKNGAHIAVINNYREPGMERYWIPSVAESALFGTRIGDSFYDVNAGADVAFLNGAAKWIIENDAWDKAYVANHTDDFERLADSLCDTQWEDLESQSGVSRDVMEEYGQRVAAAERAVFVWSMGITQHEHGVDNVQAIVNLALLKGFVGREGCGLMPIRGHSGVQGGAEMGAYSTAYPGGKAITAENAATLTETWGFEVPTTTGLQAPQMIDAASRGDLDVLFSVGGNWLEVLPDPDYVRVALSKVPLRVHMDIVLSPQMFVDPGETVILLPATTRYEVAGGVTQTSTERRVIFSPEIEGPRVSEARSEWKVFGEVAARVKPEVAEKVCFENTVSIREEIAAVIPVYDGIQHLRAQGDQFQYGGAYLCTSDSIQTADGKAHFHPVTARAERPPEGYYFVATRRGKQFNSMIHEKKDSLNGVGRDAILMNRGDAAVNHLSEGDGARLRANGNEYEGRVVYAPIKPGNIQVHWPEGNVLLDKSKRSPEAGVPDYNALVTIEALAPKE